MYLSLVRADIYPGGTIDVGHKFLVLDHDCDSIRTSVQQYSAINKLVKSHIETCV